MNKNFTDNTKSVFIKVLANEKKAEREVIGSKIFSKFIKTPIITQVDSKTLLIQLMKGTKATEVNEETLTKLITNELSARSRNETKQIPFNLSIFGLIAKLKVIQSNKVNIIKKLNEIEIRLLAIPLVPIQGDLQKQNIFMNEGKLVYIDFEHFIFAPIEMEIVNSLFFSDDNCLDAGSIITMLVQEKIFNPVTLSDMLFIFVIKQLSQGRPIKDVMKKSQTGFAKLSKILNDPTLKSLPDFGLRASTNIKISKEITI